MWLSKINGKECGNCIAHSFRLNKTWRSYLAFTVKLAFSLVLRLAASPSTVNS